MFQKMLVLDAQAHSALRFDARQSYLFAAREMLVPVTAGEASRVAREYPIVFVRKPGSAPSALVGVQEGINAYVSSSGHWMARYVPAHVRRYPFRLAPLAPPEGAAAGTNGDTPPAREWVVTFDEAAPHLGQEAGEPLFDDQGQPTATARHVREVLANLERDHQRTLGLMAQIEETGWLVERPLRVAPKSGKPLQLEGLRVLDVDAFARADAAQLKALHDSGALGLLYAHLLSLANLEDSPLTQHRGEATETLVGNAALDFSGVDWSKLS